MDPTSPLARALRTLESIQSSPGITADRHADRLGVSARAVRRYVAILREADVPIESVRGPYGGYHLGRGHRPPPLIFTGTEALALVMAALDGSHDAGDPTQPVGAALAKLLQAMPASVAAHAEAVRRTPAAAPDRAAARPDPSVTASLVAACGAHRRVRLGYRSEAGREWEALVDPWTVVVRHGRWYLLCFAHQAGATRTYQVDRVRYADVLDEPFDPPAIDDPVATLESYLSVGWEYPVEIDVGASREAVAACVAASLDHLEPTGPASCRLTGSTSDPEWYARQLTALPGPFHVVRSAELRTAVQQLGQRLCGAADTQP